MDDQPDAAEDGSPAGRDHTHTIVSDLGGSVVSISFLTSEQAAAYESQADKE